MLRRKLRVYRAGIHLGEERIVEGNHNSGMVTFSGCHLACNFCYTPETSVDEKGVDLSALDFYELLDELIVRGARNINLISPSHVWGTARPAVEKIKQRYGRRLPIILKVSGYEKEGLLRTMSPLGDVFVPDFKVWSPTVAKAVNLPSDYGKVTLKALESLSQSHGTLLTPEGKLSCGILTRHLMMPDFFEDSLDVVEALGSINYQGYLNIMTYFVDPKQRRVVNANLKQVDIMVLKAKEFGIQVLVNGKPAKTNCERKRYA